MTPSVPISSVDSTPPAAPTPSRRALLAGALGGLGALVASAIGRASPVRGAEGEAVVVGGDYTASTSTGFTTTTGSGALYGSSLLGYGVQGTSNSQVGVSGASISSVGVIGGSSSGVAIQGQSNSNIGVRGISNQYVGVYGDSNSNHGVVGNNISTGHAAMIGYSGGNSTGVEGVSGGGVVIAAKPKTGVFGYAAQDAASQGVWGHSPAGNGVVGSTSTGYAGYFSGKVYSTQFYELSEIGTPAAPAPNRARLFVKDNGAGKTQLCVRFNTGAVQIIKTQA